MGDLRVRLSLLPIFSPNREVIDCYGRCEGGHNVSRNGLTRIDCDMSLPDQDTYSIGPHYRNGHLTLLLDRAARFATSWMETMFFSLYSPESAQSNGSVCEASPIGFSLRHAIKPGCVCVKADYRNDSPLDPLM